MTIPSSEAELNELMGEVLGGGDGVDLKEAELLLLLPGDVPNMGKAVKKNIVEVVEFQVLIIRYTIWVVAINECGVTVLDFQYLVRNL